MMKKGVINIKRSPADKWFSFFIRFRDKWTCQICGVADRYRQSTTPDGCPPGPSIIECLHLVSRGSEYSASRHDARNGIAGCQDCHERFTFDELAWKDWCREKFGEDLMDDLRRLNRTPNPSAKWGMEELMMNLKEATIRLAVEQGNLWILRTELTKADKEFAESLKK